MVSMFFFNQLCYNISLFWNFMYLVKNTVEDHRSSVCYFNGLDFDAVQNLA